MLPFLAGLLETAVVASPGALLLYARRGRRTVMRCLCGALLGYVASFPILMMLLAPPARAAFWSGLVGVVLGVAATGERQRTAD